MKNSLLIKKELEDQEAVISFVGSIFIILSGIILYLDKIIHFFNINIGYEFKYYHNLEDAIWYGSQTISPLLIVLGSLLKARKWCYFAPVSAFSVQFIYLIKDEVRFEDDYFWLYSVSAIFSFFLFHYLINNLLRKYSLNIFKLKSAINSISRFAFIGVRKHLKEDENTLKEYQKDMFNALKDGMS